VVASRNKAYAGSGVVALTISAFYKLVEYTITSQ